MLILRDRRGREFKDWELFKRLYLSDEYPLVADTAVEAGGGVVHVRTRWTGGTEINEVTMAEEGHLFESNVRGGRLDGQCVGYSLLIHAIRGHDRLVRR